MRTKHSLIAITFFFIIINFLLYFSVKPICRKRGSTEKVYKQPYVVYPVKQKIDPIVNYIYKTTIIIHSKGYRTNWINGAGVIVSHDGYIITANHLVKDVIVVNFDGKNYKANLIRRFPGYDLALVKIDRKSMPYSRFSYKYRKYLSLYLSGNPWNKEHITTGIADDPTFARLPGNIVPIYANNIKTKIVRGYSGGGVFDANTGNLCGIIVGLYPNGNAVAIKIENCEAVMSVVNNHRLMNK